MPKVTAIIPIYNVEIYLDQCLNSICAQTLEDIEIICVNDGSTDGSLSIINKHAAKNPRIIIIDKENGGYGKAVNCGLDRAQGEYIGIIEPDDFIDAHMFADLYDFAHRSQLSDRTSTAAIDVVKSSYWEYYDSPGNGGSPLLSRPALSYSMPNDISVFSLEQSQDVICSHPSIWSALYRREFLEDKNIRFVEPRGAGWADNPFLFQTLVLASSICWVPKAYYYYRQTNISASSFLKDFHMPFDRLRDIRQFLKTQNQNSDILAAFYKREFDYINDVVTTFGFSDTDPEVRREIETVVASMDPSIVLTHPRLCPGYTQVYQTYAETLAIAPRDGSSTPLLSIVLPVGGNTRDLIGKTLACINNMTSISLECICVEYETLASGFAHCLQAAEFDRRFVTASIDGSYTAAINEGLSRALGQYALCMNAGDIVFEKSLQETLSLCKTHQVDACFCMSKEPRTRHLVQEIHFENGLRLANNADCKDNLDIADAPVLYHALDASRKSELFSGLSFSLCDRVFNPSLIRESNMSFDREDSTAGIILAAELLRCASKPGFRFASLGGANAEPSKKVRSFPEPLIQKSEVHTFHTSAVLQSLDIIQSCGSEETWNNAWRNLLLVSFITDLIVAPNEEIASLCYEQYSDTVMEELMLDEHTIPSLYDDVEAYNSLAYLHRYGLERFNYRQFCIEMNRRQVLEQEIDELYESHAFKIGDKAVKLAKSIIPADLIAKVRGKSSHA